MLKSRLARRYWIVVTVFVSLAALVLGAVQALIAYRSARLDAVRLQAAELAAIGARVEASLESITASLARLCAMPWTGSLLTPDDMRAEFHSLLTRQPAVLELQGVAADGRETVFVSRIALDRITPVRQPSPVASRTETGTVRLGEVFFRDSLSPHVKLACREKGVATGTLLSAEMNLEFVSELVGESARRVDGEAFMADEKGRLIAHSRPATVFSAGVQALGGLAGPAQTSAPVSRWIGTAFDGALVSSASVSGTPWTLSVSQPASLVLRPAFGSVAATIATAFGMAVAAALAALWLASRLAQPVRTLRLAVDAVAKGRRVETLETGSGDELDELAHEFDLMAAQVREYTLGLERKVDERTAELRAAMRARALFLAAASHDLRQPLYAISILADTLALEQLAPGARETLTRQREAIAVLRGLFDNLLDLSRFDSGDIRVNRRLVALREILGPIAVEHEVVSRAKGLQWRCEIDDAWVETDPELIRRITANLLSNAVRYTPAGSVALVARRAGDRVTLTVSDTGVGIAPADQARVFEEFVQLDNPSRERDRGVGLGLSIVKKISELLAANLRLQSTPGAGTVVSIDIPVAEAVDAVERQAEPADAVGDLAGARVWIVEDDPLVRGALDAQFVAWGVDFTFAADRGEVEALREADGGWPDAAILDDMLGRGERGLDIACWLACHMPRERIVLVSGNVEPAAAETLRASGFTVLRKPLASAVLAQWLQSALRSRPATRDQAGAPAG